MNKIYQKNLALPDALKVLLASKHFFCTISSRANPCAVPHATKPHSLCRFREVQDAGGENCMTTVG